MVMSLNMLFIKNIIDLCLDFLALLEMLYWLIILLLIQKYLGMNRSIWWLLMLHQGPLLLIGINFNFNMDK